MGRRLSQGLADADVATTLNHLPRAAAMGCCIAQTDNRDAVHKYRGAAFGAVPGVGAAAGGVHAGIPNAQNGLAVDGHVRGTGDGRPGNVVGTAVFAVGISGTVGVVSNAADRGHGGSLG